MIILCRERLSPECMLERRMITVVASRHCQTFFRGDGRSIYCARKLISLLSPGPSEDTLIIYPMIQSFLFFLVLSGSQTRNENPIMWRGLFRASVREFLKLPVQFTFCDADVSG
jgi:hypothetical protein